jgi:outer membrane cobalamin receptor
MSATLAMFALVFAVLAGTPALPLVVVDERGAPVAHVRVEFVDATGKHDLERTDATGRASAAAGFTPVFAELSAPGYEARRVALPSDLAQLTLQRSLPVVGSVTVATGARADLHDLPFAASLLDRAAIALSPSVATDRLLRQLPGFDAIRSNGPFTNYGQLRASFSGAGQDLGVVLADGVPAQDAFGGQIDWQAYPSQELQRAELLRGAGSSLYGSGAVGGALELTTFAPLTGAGLGADGRLRLAAGTNDSRDDGVQLRTPIGDKLAASLSYVNTGSSYADLPPAYAAPDDRNAVSNTSVTHLKLRYDDGATNVTASGLFAWDGLFEGRPNYNFERTLDQESLEATHAVGAALASFGVYARSTSVINTADMFPGSPGSLLYTQYVPTEESGFDVSFATPARRPLVGTLLVDQRSVTGRSTQDGPTGALTALGTGSQLLQGVALQLVATSGAFEAVAGVRGDLVGYGDLQLQKISKGVTTTTNVQGYDDGAISPRLALRYNLSPAIALRVSSGGGFRAPYLNELLRGYQIGKVVYAPNPFLVPERARTDDAGIDVLLGRGGRLAFDITAVHVNDDIGFVTIGPTLQKRENLESTQTNGETLGYTQALGACTRLRASATGQNPRVTAGPAGTVGKQLAYVPNESVTLGLDGTSAGPFSFSLDGSYLGQTYADAFEQEPLGSALLLGATLQATAASGATFALTGDNLSSQRYLSSIDRYGPPLTIMFRIGVPLGPTTARAPGCHN